jgi:hypothetical protein
MIDRCPETEYPHQTALRLVTTPIIILAVIIMTLGVMEQIQNCVPRKRKPRLSRYARRC